MGRMIALLRGINVGGKRRIGMQNLREALTSSGLEDVRTYVQSGNVVFATPRDGIDGLDTAMERTIAEAFDLDVKVVLRTREEFLNVSERNPMRDDGHDPAKLHVVFLKEPASAERCEQLDPDRSPPDRFIVSGREIYLYYPNGAARSKLTADYFERTLRATGTARNWNTVQKLLEMTAP